MLKDEWIGLFDTLRSCVFSPTGLNILAQGKAKRRPGYATASSLPTFRDHRIIEIALNLTKPLRFLPLAPF